MRKYWFEAEEYIADEVITEPSNLTMIQINQRLAVLEEMFKDRVEVKLLEEELKELAELEKENAVIPDADKERISFLKLRSDYHSLKDEKKSREDKERNYEILLDELSPDLLKKFLLIAVEFARPNEIEPLLARGADPSYLKASATEFKPEVSQRKLNLCQPLGLIFEIEKKLAELTGRVVGELRIFCHKDDDGKLKPKLVITQPSVISALEQALSVLDRPVSLSEVGNRQASNLSGQFRRSVESTRAYFNQGMPTKTPKTAGGDIKIMPVVNFNCDFKELNTLLEAALLQQRSEIQSQGKV